jgi:peptidyl-prolyl cis-trans isomerase A (cyclophilin A)
MMLNKFSQVFGACALWAISSFTGATVVQMQTEFGEIQVNLFDDATPATVNNFLSYVENGDYRNTLIHRSINGFITQSGGYYLEENEGVLNLSSIIKKAPVINEPVYSNVRGTIAMAKLSSLPNSATSEWFINLADNHCNLDTQNSGFTVFGKITDESLAMLDTIAALPTYNASHLGSALTNTPLDNFPSDKPEALALQHFVFINAVSVVDTNINSADTLTPTLNTLITGGISSDCEINNDSGSGSITVSELLMSMLLLLGLGRRNHLKAKKTGYVLK